MPKLTQNGLFSRHVQAAMLIEDLKEGFRELLVAASWMDSETYSRAIHKLNSMLEYVGYPDIYVNNITVIDEEYRDVRMRSFGEFPTSNEYRFNI